MKSSTQLIIKPDNIQSKETLLYTIVVDMLVGILRVPIQRPMNK